MQRITDIWRNLVSYRNEADDPWLGEASQTDEELMHRDEQISESYRNQYWTWIISLQSNRVQPVTREQLTSDIIDSLNAVQELDHDEEIVPLFDPAEFIRANPAPSIEDFRLDEDALLDWGRRCSIVRQSIDERADRLGWSRAPRAPAS